MSVVCHFSDIYRGGYFCLFKMAVNGSGPLISMDWIHGGISTEDQSDLISSPKQSIGGPDQAGFHGKERLYFINHRMPFFLCLLVLSHDIRWLPGIQPKFHANSCIIQVHFIANDNEKT
jgi:hypothetical protein